MSLPSMIWHGAALVRASIWCDFFYFHVLLAIPSIVVISGNVLARVGCWIGYLFRWRYCNVEPAQSHDLYLSSAILPFLLFFSLFYWFVRVSFYVVRFFMCHLSTVVTLHPSQLPTLKKKHAASK